MKYRQIQLTSSLYLRSQELPRLDALSVIFSRLDALATEAVELALLLCLIVVLSGWRPLLRFLAVETTGEGCGNSVPPAARVFCGVFVNGSKCGAAAALATCVDGEGGEEVFRDDVNND